MRSHPIERNARSRCRRLAAAAAALACCLAAMPGCDDGDGQGGDDDLVDATDTTSPPDAADTDETDTTDTTDTSTPDTAAPDTVQPDLDDAIDAGDADADVSAPPDYLTALATEADFDALRDADDQLKYLFNADGATPLEPLTWPCTFQNSARYPYHIQFLHTLEPLAEMTFQQYTAAILVRETRVWWGGELQRWPRTPHPGSGVPGVMIYTLYTGPSADEAPTVAELVEVDTRMRQCAPFAADTLVLLPTDPWQEDAVEANEQALTDAGVSFLYPNQLVP